MVKNFPCNEQIIDLQLAFGGWLYGLHLIGFDAQYCPEDTTKSRYKSARGQLHK